MTADEFIAQVVAAAIAALYDGRLSTYTTPEEVEQILGLDVLRQEQPTQ